MKFNNCWKKFDDKIKNVLFTKINKYSNIIIINIFTNISKSEKNFEKISKIKKNMIKKIKKIKCSIKNKVLKNKLLLFIY